MLWWLTRLSFLLLLAYVSQAESHYSVSSLQTDDSKGNSEQNLLSKLLNIKINLNRKKHTVLANNANQTCSAVLGVMFTKYFFAP